MTEKIPDFKNPEVIQVDQDKIACDGGGAATGHPLVYLPFFADKDFVECPYCDRRFVRGADFGSVASGH